MSKRRSKARARLRQAMARSRRQRAGLAQRMLDPETEYRATMLTAGLSTEPRPIEALLAASAARRAVITVITDGLPSSTGASWSGIEIQVDEPLVENDLHELLDTGTPIQIVVAALPETSPGTTRLMGWDAGPDGVAPMDAERIREVTSTDPRTGQLLPPEPDVVYAGAPRVSLHYR